MALLFPLNFWVSFSKHDIRKKGTLIIKGLLGNLDYFAGKMGPDQCVGVVCMSGH